MSAGWSSYALSRHWASSPPAAATTTANDSGSTGSSAQLDVGTTVAPITSIAANIGGDRVKITGIVPEGTNSHTFEPKPSVAELLSGLDVLFVNGLKLEEPTKELAQENLSDGAEIVELGTKSIPAREYAYDFSFPRSGGKPNPHLWTDPKYALKYAAIIRDTLSERDAGNADYFAANYDKFKTKVDAFDTAMRTSFATIPRAKRKLLTYHDAYAYFARNYGWDVIGAIQVSDFEDPTAEGGGGAHRPGARREGARDLRLGGLPEPGARADRQGGRREVRRRAARRRPARRARRSRSTRGWASCTSTT